MVYVQELLIYICIRCRATYNRRGMSNMQLNDGPHGAWAGACRTRGTGYRVDAMQGAMWVESTAIKKNYYITGSS